MHIKVLEKGKPDDVPPGIKGVKVNFFCSLNGIFIVWPDKNNQHVSFLIGEASSIPSFWIY